MNERLNGCWGKCSKDTHSTVVCLKDDADGCGHARARPWLAEQRLARFPTFYDEHLVESRRIGKSSKFFTCVFATSPADSLPFARQRRLPPLRPRSGGASSTPETMTCVHTYLHGLGVLHDALRCEVFLEYNFKIIFFFLQTG